MNYEAFNYVGASFFGVPLIPIAVGLLLALSFLGGLATYKIIYKSQRPLKLIGAWVLVALLFSVVLGVHLSNPSPQEQKDKWNTKITEQFNDTYDLDLSPEEFAFLSDFQDFPNRDTVYGPILKLQTGDETQEFSSLVLARSKDKLELLELVGADYVVVPTAKA